MAMLVITRWYHNWLPFVLIKPTSTADSRPRDPQKNCCEFFDVDPIFTWKIMKKSRNLVHFLGRTWRFFRGFQWSLRKADPESWFTPLPKSDSWSNLKNSANGITPIQFPSFRWTERDISLKGHSSWTMKTNAGRVPARHLELTRWPLKTWLETKAWRKHNPNENGMPGKDCSNFTNFT